jgi:hypothetical protein
MGIRVPLLCPSLVFDYAAVIFQRQDVTAPSKSYPGGTLPEG